MEHWKIIEDFNRYSVSDAGRIKNNHTQHILIGGDDKDGYQIVTLSNGKKQFSKRVCRLVAMAFIPNPNDSPQVNHKNENKHDDRIENLEWCTPIYNNNYGSRTQKTRKRVKCIELDKIFDGIRVAERELNISHQSIGHACRSNIKAGGYHWKYVEDKGRLNERSNQNISRYSEYK